MHSSTTSPLPSSLRPIPLRMRTDLIARRIDYQERGYWVVKDPIALKYHRLLDEQYRLLCLLDGEHSLEDMLDELLDEFPTLNWTQADIQHLISDLHSKRLAYSHRFGQYEPLSDAQRRERRQKLLRTATNFLFLKLPGFDPEPLLRVLYPLCRWMFHPLSVLAAACLVGVSLLWLAVHFDDFTRQLPQFEQFFGWPNLMYLWLTLAVTKLLHEFGHGLTCKHFGGECHEIGIMILIFTPTLYCDVSDSWMLPNKWHRIAIGAGGMAVEAMLSAIALLVWWNTVPGVWHHTALNVFFITAVTTTLFNLNPLMRLDGYYMLSDWLGIPNLRSLASRHLWQKFGWYCLGIEARRDPFMPERARDWFNAYAVAAAVYRWTLMLAIALMLYTQLKPSRLQNLAALVGSAMLASMVVAAVYQAYRITAAPRRKPIAKFKLVLTCLVVALVGAVIAAVPIPVYLEAACFVQPHDARHVFTTLPGRLETVRGTPGQVVRQGDVLAVLSNFQMENARRALGVEQTIHEARVELYHALAQPSQRVLAAERVASDAKRLHEFESQLRQLTITAPCDGRLISPPKRDEPDLDDEHVRLTQWYSRPLEERNVGCFLEERTHVCSIAPDERMEAVLVVDQADRNDLRVGQKVKIKFDHLPGRVWAGTVEQFSRRHQQFVSPSLSNKSGGSLPTVTDAAGREKLTSVAYEAIVALDPSADLSILGLRGRARCVLWERPAGELLWRFLRRTIHFRL